MSRQTADGTVRGGRTTSEAAIADAGQHEQRHGDDVPGMAGIGEHVARQRAGRGRLDARPGRAGT